MRLLRWWGRWLRLGLGRRGRRGRLRLRLWLCSGCWCLLRGCGCRLRGLFGLGGLWLRRRWSGRLRRPRGRLRTSLDGPAGRIFGEEQVVPAQRRARAHARIAADLALDKSIWSREVLRLQVPVVE